MKDYNIFIIHKMSNPCQIEALKYINEIVEFSGKFIFQKGNVEECMRNQAFKYALVEFGHNSQDSKAYMGLCAPRECNDTVITTSINSFLEQIKFPINVYSITTNPQNYNTKMTWLSYVIICILGLLLLLPIILAIKRLNTKTTNKKSILDAFDISRNLDYFNTRPNQPLNILDGIRAISMMWVVFGHTYLFYMNAGMQNSSSLIQISLRPFFLLTEGGMFSVDVFFMLGGFLLSFVYLKQSNNKISFVGLAALQRILRIWPAYILAMLFASSLFIQLGSGIFWNMTESLTQKCQSTWSQMLFIANYVNGQSICLGWTWYLQVQFQLFLIGTLILFLYYRSKKLAFSIALFLSIGSTIFVMVYTLKKEVKITADVAHSNSTKYFVDVYIKPWGRCAPYFMGLVLGVMYAQYRKYKQAQHVKPFLVKVYNFCLDRKRRVALEWLGIGLMAMVVFVPRSFQIGTYWPQLAHSIYWTFSRAIFVFGTILTILPTMLGHSHSFFNFILTAKILQFIARISFCTYLIHVMVIYQFTYTRNYDIYYAIIDTFVVYLGILTLCLFFGFLMTVFVELPFAKLQKTFIQSLTSKGQQRSKLLQLNQSINKLGNNGQAQQ